jgi:signal transduction histidine kinase
MVASFARAEDTFASLFSTEWKSLQSEMHATDARLKRLPGIPADDLGTNRAFLRVFSPQQTNPGREVDFVIRILWQEPQTVDLIALVPARKSHRTGIDFNYGFPEDFEVSLLRPDKSTERIATFRDMSRHPALNGHPVVARPTLPLKSIGVEVRVTRTRPPREGTPVMAFVALSEILCFSGKNNLAAAGRVEIDSPGIDPTPPYWTPSLLTDGATPLGLPERPLPTGEPKLIGWISTAKQTSAVPLTITLDLGATREIDGLRLLPALRPSIADFHGFGLPKRFLLSASDSPDGTRRILLDRRGIETPESGHNPVGFRFPSATARFVHLESTLLWKAHELYPAFLGFSEIEILARDEVVSLNAKVTVPEARQTVPAHARQSWSPRALVDGLGPGGELIPVRTWIEELDLRLALETRRHEALEKSASLETSWRRGGITAITAAGLSILGLAAFLPFHYRWREHRQIRQIRERIAGDLHDDVGSNLGSIQMLSAIARERPDNRDELETIHRVAAETVNSVRDIVWLLQHRESHRIAIIDHLRESAAILLDAMESIRWSIRSDFQDWTLGDADSRHLMLFFREVLHNIRRHSDASEVDIRLAWEGKSMLLQIRDNGRGIPADLLERPSTLRAIRQRAARLGGTLDVLSSPGSGTEITLRFVPSSPGSAASPTLYPETP